MRARNLRSHNVTGLLHIGDIIKEVNGQEVIDPNQLTNMLKKVNGTVTFKVLPCIDEQVGQQQVRNECV
jgi:PDZ domain-containing secreted protein